MPDTCHLALLGDFSGRAERGLVETGRALATRRRLEIDRDNLEEVMARLGVELAGIRFRELDDFHPDRLYDRLPLFQALRALRSKLEDPAYVAELVRPQPAARPAPESLVSGNLLDDILGEAATPQPRPDEFERFLRGIVEPHLAAGTGKADRARQAELLDKADQAIAAQMREILHHPDFQALEAAWRGADLLVRRVETSPELKIYLLDVSKQEIAEDLAAASSVAQSGLYKLLTDHGSYAAVAGLYSFGAGREDLALLAGLAEIGRMADAPWLCGAEATLAGCRSLAATPDPDDWSLPVPEAWRLLRHHPAARWLGLLLPRFLVRVPYGASGSRCERFAFEEVAGLHDHDAYLWGNPALLAAMLLLEGVAEEGESFRPGVHHQIGGLPLHTGTVDGGPEMKPCAEIWMTERAAGKLLAQGLMPVASMKNSDAVQVIRFQSAADPVRALGGRWGA